MEISVFAIIGLGIISALVCLLLKQYRPEYALSASLICGVVIFTIVVAQMTPLFDTIRSILERVEGGMNMWR